MTAALPDDCSVSVTEADRSPDQHRGRSRTRFGVDLLAVWPSSTAIWAGVLVVPAFDRVYGTA